MGDLTLPMDDTGSDDSPRESVRAPTGTVAVVTSARESITKVTALVEATIVEALKAPKERPIDVLGPSRELYEKHELTFINNLMGLSCLFFLTGPLVVAMEFSALMEQNRATICLLAFSFVWYILQTILSFTGDYWLSRIAPETDNYVLDRVYRWIRVKHESVVVTGPHHIETWKREWVATTLDVLFAFTSAIYAIVVICWQVWHGAQLTTTIAAFATAIVCKQAGSTFWKGQNDDTYDPKKIWWFNFFHFNWHLFCNIAAYILFYDLCHHGLRAW